MKKGFTLIELIIVVIVIGVLAAIAVPQYLVAVERARGGQARSALGHITQAEKMYAAENNGAYIAATNAQLVANLGNFVEMDEIAADAQWDYAVTVTAGPPATFTITATRVGGNNNGETISLTYNGVWGGNFTP